MTKPLPPHESKSQPSNSSVSAVCSVPQSSDKRGEGPFFVIVIVVVVVVVE